ncbi:MAG: GNAT family N-acetyltransferase [Chloroflexota bacterium]
MMYRWMSPNEVSKIANIDRSETIRVGYRFENGALQQMVVNWDSPSWALEGTGEYTLAAEIRFCQSHLDKKGRMCGAFDAETLVGMGILTPDIAPVTAQLAFLHVSKLYRQQGIAGKIADILFEEAKSGGAKQIYVSATPSGSAVGFYRSKGFEPTNTPIPDLFELEPDDIHMIKFF